MPVYQTTFAVNAPAARVWDALTALDRYRNGTRRSRTPPVASSQATGSTYSWRSRVARRWPSPRPSRTRGRMRC